MSFSSINIQGNIVSSEILDKIRSEEKFKHQLPESFGLARTASLRDEIGMAWSIMRTHWQAYKKRLEALPKGDTGTSLTREKLILPLLTELGYEIAIQRAQQIGGKSYAISHGASNRGRFPIHVMGYKDHLDKRRDTGGPRLSPHALVQEYLNNTEHLFALVTNGRQLRLLRDATRLVRMSYLEFDLERMFEEELYVDFSLLFRVLHVSRMPERIDLGASSHIEFYHQESLASGTRIREKLSEAVENSIKTLANGFLAHPKNEDLVALFENKHLKADIYYMRQLRLIYRILFLIVLEERKLVYPDNLSEEQQRKRDIYYKYYSIERLRKLTENRIYVDADKYDLWESLKTTFLLFEQEQYGSKLDIKPLGSGLFAPDSLGSLKEQYLKNGVLIEVLKRLTTFVGDYGQLVRVNYSDLDVEEFGSVYEGLLEYDPKVEKIGVQWEFSFVLGEGRASSGSHYTPEELVKPLIKHSLDYIIADKLKEANPEEALLSITVCDVACGSGHILLSAARKIATELASIREGAEQASPTYYRTAIRDVICNCIYGVDLNPLAVELCKVALWLEAHNPNEPLNFLDHHIKNGNAIVGLAHHTELQNGIATKAFKTLPGDDKTLAATFRKQNDKERKNREQLSTYDIDNVDESLKGVQKEFADFAVMPENTPEQIAAKAETYKKITEGRKWYRIKNLADLQVAQFFIPKTPENKDILTSDAKYRTYLNSGTQILDRGASMAVAQQKHFFHWFLEFPEVFSKDGFDCILGNPPFLGGKKISGTYGDSFLNLIKTYFAPAIGGLDLVAYFFKRNFKLLKSNGFQSLISTNTIAQGDTRIGGLFEIEKQGGVINHAIRTMKWPGLAAVEVAVVTIYKGVWNNEIILNDRTVSQINSYLDDSITLGEPLRLVKNQNKSFIGSVINGKGFILTTHDALHLIRDDKKYKKILFPYLIGDDINNQIGQIASRWVINFNDWPLRRYTKREWQALNKEQQKSINKQVEDNKFIQISPPDYERQVASDYPECLKILENLVKPERDNLKRKSYRDKWWLYAERGVNLYNEISNVDKILIHSRVSKTHAFAFVSADQIYSEATVIFKFDNDIDFSILQSTLNENWAWKYSSTMKGDRRYSPTEAFENYPFPENRTFKLENNGNTYYKSRYKCMYKIQLGLTKAYNAFHAQEIQPTIKTSDLENKTKKEVEKQFGKEVWNLWNHLQKTEEACGWKEAVEGIVELRQLHEQMDEAVLEAYGWHEDTEKWGKAIDLHHDFYEVDYLPENDRVRYTIHPEARKEVLKRLLLLNHERYEEEIMQGLHKKKDVEAFYTQKGKPMPEGLTFSDGKGIEAATQSAKPIKKAKPKAIKPTLNSESVQNTLAFDIPEEAKTELKVTLQKQDGTTEFYHICDKAKDVAKDFTHLHAHTPLAEIIKAKEKGGKFQFEGVWYMVVDIL